jgi:hypothetical protein
VAAWLSAHPSHTPEGWPDATQPPAAATTAATAAAAAARRRLAPAGLGRAPSLRGCVVTLVVAVALGGGLVASTMPPRFQPDAAYRRDYQWMAPREWAAVGPGKAEHVGPDSTRRDLSALSALSAAFWDEVVRLLSPTLTLALTPALTLTLTPAPSQRQP